MAKSKSFFGLRSGSTKTLTFQVNQGRQITKDRVYDVKNPQTTSQMEGRCIMATVSAAYAHMKEIVDHSFEGITYGQNNMSEFIRRNYARLKQYKDLSPQRFGYNAYRDRGLYAGAYLMSMGSLGDALGLPSEVSHNHESGQQGAMNIALQNPGFSSGGTVAEYLAAGNLQVGDMVTAVFMLPLNGAAGFGFGFVRVKVKASSDEALSTTTIASCFEVETNMSDVAMRLSGGNLLVAVVTPTDAFDSIDSAPIALIHSRKAASGWLRNTTYLNFANEITLGKVFSEALATFPIGGSYVLNGGAIE